MPVPQPTPQPGGITYFPNGTMPEGAFSQAFATAIHGSFHEVKYGHTLLSMTAHAISRLSFGELRSLSTALADKVAQADDTQEVDANFLANALFDWAEDFKQREVE